jgi:microcin C transport system substrate-binding protein
MIRSTALAVSIALAMAGAARADEVEPAHGVAMHGDVKYPPDFTHFDYVNPDAPKGGQITYSAIGTFDSLNPFILRGQPAAGSGLPFETQTRRSNDEAFTEYGLLAESIEMPEDRSWVAFTLRPEARWHDGEPVTVEDVIWSLETMQAKGHPFYRAYYANVTGAEKVGERKVRFSFDGAINRELPLINRPDADPAAALLGGSRLRGHDAGSAPLGSGPYRVARVDPGRSITYERVQDYWGADIPVNKGRFNYDRVRYEYFRDSNVALEAFKAGQYDFRLENTARLWATAYTGPGIDAGLIKREEIEDESGSGMQGFVFNTRRPIFQDPRVREALGYAFDFEWSNKTLFFDQYARTASYFSNSELAATELRTSASSPCSSPSATSSPRRSSPASTSRPPPTARATSEATSGSPSRCCRKPAGRSTGRRESSSIRRPASRCASRSS